MAVTMSMWISGGSRGEVNERDRRNARGAGADGGGEVERLSGHLQ
jgi:hypothetical protein